MDISQLTPFIAMGVLGLGALIFFFVMLTKRHKKEPLTPKNIPPLPSQKEAASHFTAPPQVATVHPPSQAMTTPSKNKKIIFGVLAVFTIAIVLAVSYFVSTQKPAPIKKEAAPTGNQNPYIHLEKEVGEVRGEALVAGGTFGYYADASIDEDQPPLTVNLELETYHCPEVADANIQTCTKQTGTLKKSAVLNWGDRNVEITTSLIMEDRCGVYQVKSFYTPVNPIETTSDRGVAGATVYNWGRSCSLPGPVTPTCDPAAVGGNCGLLTSPTPTCNPAAGGGPCGLLTTPTSSANPPTPTPSPGVTVRTTTATPTPTPTTATLASAPSPTPTEIILVSTSTTPTAIATASPTIPAAGNPMALLIIAIPIILIAIAFLF